MGRTSKVRKTFCVGRVCSRGPLGKGVWACLLPSGGGRAPAWPRGLWSEARTGRQCRRSRWEAAAWCSVVVGENEEKPAILFPEQMHRYRIVFHLDKLELGKM